MDAGATTPYATHREQWLTAEPEWRIASTLFASVREPREEALLVLEYLLRDAALNVGDARVAQTKLAWWVDELARASGGGARHPVTKQLATLIERDAFDGLAGAAVAGTRLVAQDSLPASSDLIAAMRGVVAPFATVRAEKPRSDAELTTLAAATVVLAARKWARFAEGQRMLLPLDALARTGASRDAAATRPDVAAALMSDLAPALVTPLRGSDAARVAIARDVARRTQRAPEKLLAGEMLRPRFAWTWQLWRAARGA